MRKPTGRNATIAQKKFFVAALFELCQPANRLVRLVTVTWASLLMGFTVAGIGRTIIRSNRQKITIRLPQIIEPVSPEADLFTGILHISELRDKHCCGSPH